MSDLLLEIGRRPEARKLIQRLGLPLPIPEPLERGRGAWEERPLDGRVVIVGAAANAALGRVVARTLAAAGAEPHLASAGAVAVERAPFDEAGEAWGRPPRLVPDLDAAPGAWALVFDASSIDGPDGLRALYDFFHPLVGRLRRSGRALVLGRRPERAATPAAAAAQAGLDGFVRSLAKEVGRRGATANLVRVDDDAAARLPGPLRFLLSPRSAFVTAQPLVVDTVSTLANGHAADASGEPPWVRPLEGKVALVTGGARGIGEATVRRLAAEGARVVVLDRPADDAPASQVARAVGGAVLLADVAAADAAERIAAEIAERWGGVDVVVHNAGITRDRTLAKMKPELWDQALAVNLAAVVRVTDALLGKKLVRDGGRLVCLSSVAGLAGNLGQTNYAAAKAGVAGFVRALAPTLSRRGITVNALAPGFIETRLTAAIPLFIREAGRRLSALGQGGLPLDVAELVTFLASPGAAGVTGQVIRVCGGALIGA